MLPLIPQSYFTMPLPAETTFIEIKGLRPSKFEKKHQQLNGHQRATVLIDTTFESFDLP
jgi:hypothetical protein